MVFLLYLLGDNANHALADFAPAVDGLVVRLPGARVLGSGVRAHYPHVAAVPVRGHAVLEYRGHLVRGLRNLPERSDRNIGSNRQNSAGITR